jgi:aspartate carbamoyltransferase catalytic subunit
VPKSFESIAAGPGTVRVHHELDPLLGEVDAIMMLRVQFERSDRTGGGAAPLITADYHALYGLTAERAARLPEHAVVLHPGPVNRGLELDSEVMDDPQRSAILQQASNGVAVRMAVMAMTLGAAD